MNLDISVFRREPSTEEIAAATAEIESQELAILALQQRIHDLTGEIAAARRAQGYHRDIIARCRGVTTLARRIPEELLAQIFERCVADGWTRAPVVVSHVCTSWRKAVALNPRIWSHVYVNGDSHHFHDRTRLWLSMAKHAPLHIYVTASWRIPASHLEHSMELLADHHQQWSSLSVELESLNTAWQLLRKCTHPMPRLTEFFAKVDIQFTAVLDGEPEEFLLADVFTVERAPKLQFIDFTCNVPPNNLTFPAHLTSLNFSIKENSGAHPLLDSSLLSLLESLPVLEQLTLSLPLDSLLPFIPIEDGHQGITMNCLTSLTIHGPPALVGLLSHMRTPSLQGLHLRSLQEDGQTFGPVGPAIIRYLQESIPPLELLELYDLDLSSESFIECFSLLPTLRELRLHESSISDATLRQCSKLCPQLARIDFRWCGMLSGKSLVQFVRSRNLCEDGTLRGKASLGHYYLSSPPGDLITEVAVLNCCFVEEQDVLDLARMTVCRVSLKDNDFCRTYTVLHAHANSSSTELPTGSRQCCDNGRYRLRLQLRHTAAFNDTSSQLQLIL